MIHIGEFSHSTRLTIKTLRYYQELGILVPAGIDPQNGYRLYNQTNFQEAQRIIMLKELGFSLKEIREIFDSCNNDEEVQGFIKKKLHEVEQNLRKLKSRHAYLQNFHALSGEGSTPPEEGITEFTFTLPLYASRFIQGEYSQLGQEYSHLFKKYGRFVSGKPYAFYHDVEYRKENASMEAVLCLKSVPSTAGLHTLSFPPTRAIKLLHKGPYGTQGGAYMDLFEYLEKRDLSVKAPVIEHFVRGPGMIFRGNPDEYLTECIILVSD